MTRTSKGFKGKDNIMTTQDFEKLVGTPHVSEPIVLENGIYDGHGGVLHADGGIIIDRAGSILRNVTIYGSIAVTGRNAVIQNCKIKADTYAIFASGCDVIIRNNEIDAPSAIMIEPGAQNILIAQNNTHGDVKIDGALNCSVVLNKANKISVESSTSVYLSANDFEGKATLKNNDYLLCDNNAASVFDVSGNKNTNGDNITDVNARAEYGANEDILPHTNKNLFAGMPRKKTVTDADYDEMLDFTEYIKREATSNHIVIIPPGAYAVDREIWLGAECSNCKIYAYGVFTEKTEYAGTYTVSGVENLELHGITTGYAQQSCGQVHVLDVIDDCTFLAITAAGMLDDFGKSDTSRFHAGFVNIFRAGHIEPYGSFGGNYEIEKLDGGIMKFKIPENHDKVGKVYKGDILTCRMALPFLRSIYFENCKNVLVKDTVLYGYSSALAIVMSGDSQNVRMVRWHDTAKFSPAIDEATYSKYKALEEKYGVDLEVYIDDRGRWRGSTPRLSSMDSSHITGSREGLSCISCIMENMCDDATNQRASSARLHSLTDLGDGRTSLKYKHCATEVYFNIDRKPTARGSLCPPFKAGDHILAYASSGRTLCNTHTLSATEKVGELAYIITAPSHSKDYTADIFEIIVPTADVDFSVIEGLDLEDNHYRLDNKVFVDNLDRNSAGYLFDNVLMQDARARGALVKTVDATVRNCTFRNLLHSAVMFSAEPSWGESSVPQNVTIEKCLFDHTGYTNEDYGNRRYTPISVYGQGTLLDRDALLYRDLSVRECKFKNIYTEVFVYINAAQKVTIENNIFERSENSPYKDSPLILDVTLAADVTFKGNTYPCDAKAEDRVTGQRYQNVSFEGVSLSKD